MCSGDPIAHHQCIRSMLVGYESPYTYLYHCTHCMRSTMTLCTSPLDSWKLYSTQVATTMCLVLHGTGSLNVDTGCGELRVLYLYYAPTRVGCIAEDTVPQSPQPSSTLSGPVPCSTSLIVVAYSTEMHSTGYEYVECIGYRVSTAMSAEVQGHAIRQTLITQTS